MRMAEGFLVAILGEGATAVVLPGGINTSFDEVMGNSRHGEGLEYLVIRIVKKCI